MLIADHLTDLSEGLRSLCRAHVPTATEVGLLLMRAPQNAIVFGYGRGSDLAVWLVK